MTKGTLTGRVALITGVSRRQGIGYGIAERLAAFGADLFIHAFSSFDAAQPWGADPGGRDAIVTALQRHGTKITQAEADLLDPKSSQRLVTAANQALGHIDILIANHAYSTLGELEDLTAEEIDKHLQINVRGTLLLTQAFAA